MRVGSIYVRFLRRLQVQNTKLYKQTDPMTTEHQHKDIHARNLSGCRVLPLVFAPFMRVNDTQYLLYNNIYRSPGQLYTCEKRTPEHKQRRLSKKPSYVPQEPSYVPASEPKFLRMFVDIYLGVKAKRKACGQGRCCKIPRGCPAATHARPCSRPGPASHGRCAGGPCAPPPDAAGTATLYSARHAPLLLSTSLCSAPGCLDAHASPCGTLRSAARLDLLCGSLSCTARTAARMSLARPAAHLAVPCASPCCAPRCAARFALLRSAHGSLCCAMPFSSASPCRSPRPAAASPAGYTPVDAPRPAARLALLHACLRLAPLQCSGTARSAA